MNRNDLKIWLTNKIRNMVDEAIANIPEGTANVRLVQNHHHDYGRFAGHRYWTAVDCRYTDAEGKTLKVVEIDDYADWTESDPANYILARLGYYKPFSNDNFEGIRYRYERLLDDGRIYPINHIYSDEYLFKSILKKAIDSNSDEEIKLVFVLDYDYADEKIYSVRGKIEAGGKSFITRPEHETKMHMLLNSAYNELINNGVENVAVDYDMAPEDKDYLFKYSRWTDITFDNF